MAYVSLYRKYRPQTFGDVVGQGHVTRTVINAIDEDRLHHAYLFTGPRGTGKTSTARILAKSINCVEGPTSTPCNVCDLCVSITNGSSVDVIELDMASHGGVDDARELRDRALFAPAQARKKVYILDEVHMASTAAFNALLKLIEEPPGHVVFAMATTDPQKVLPTIMSRVQRLDLRRIGAEDLVGHVGHICELEGYAIDDEAASAVVRAGDGSARDTLSVLEQVLSYAGREVTAEKVAQVLGITPLERTFQTVDHVAGRDLAALFGLVQGLLDDGHDLRRFTLDLLQHLRDLLVLQVAPDRPDLVDATQDRRDRLSAQRDVLPRETLLRAVAVLAETIVEMRQGPARLPLELALATLAVPSLAGDTAGLADRLARLETAAPPAAPSTSAAPTASPAPTAGPAVRAAPAPVPTTAAAPDRAPDPAPAPTPEAAPTPLQQPPTPAPVEQPAAEAPAPRPVRAAREERAAAPPTDPDPADAPNVAGTSTAERLSARAASHASEPPDGPVEPHPVSQDGPEGLPPGPAADVPVTDATVAGGDEDLARVKERWPAILDLVKDTSRRFHAVYEPGDPIDLRRGVLTLKYGPKYASFHAQNAKKGDHVAALSAAVERSCGLKVKVETVVDGDAKRRPHPPVVGAAAPAATATDEPSVEEQSDVREAEQSAEPPSPDGPIEELLGRELGAELIEEHAPSDG